MKPKCKTLKAKIGAATTKKQRGKRLFEYMKACKPNAMRRFGKKRRSKK